MPEQGRRGGEVPIILTERLRLRGHREDDLDDCAAMWADPAVTRYIGGTPLSREDVWSRILRYVGHWTLLGYGFWAVEERAGGGFVGELGFADFRRDLSATVVGLPEAGWVLATRHHGVGYATEAVRAILAWGETHFISPRSFCMIDPGNRPSVRVAEKCGFREVERTTYKGQPSLLLVRNGP
jgi:RimJ/RimL family protein N-acetyltransferase